MSEVNKSIFVIAGLIWKLNEYYIKVSAIVP
jgi:hypothetical protein